VAVSCRPSKGDRPRPFPRPSPYSDQNSLKEFRQKDGALVTDDALPSAEKAA